MTTLAAWLRRQLSERQLTLQAAAVHAGVGMATLSDILNKGHVPRIDTLLRIADYFGTPHLEILTIAGNVRLASELSRTDALGQESCDSELEAQLLREFRSVPREWRADVVQQVRWIASLARRPCHHVDSWAWGSDEQGAGAAASLDEQANF